MYSFFCAQVFAFGDGLVALRLEELDFISAGLLRKGESDSHTTAIRASLIRFLFSLFPCCNIVSDKKQEKQGKTMISREITDKSEKWERSQK